MEKKVKYVVDLGSQISWGKEVLCLRSSLWINELICFDAEIIEGNLPEYWIFEVCLVWKSENLSVYLHMTAKIMKREQQNFTWHSDHIYFT